MLPLLANSSKLTSFVTQKLLYLGLVMTFSHRPPFVIQYVQYILANCLGVKANVWRCTLLIVLRLVHQVASFYPYFS